MYDEPPDITPEAYADARLIAVGLEPVEYRRTKNEQLAKRREKRRRDEEESVSEFITKKG